MRSSGDKPYKAKHGVKSNWLNSMTAVMVFERDIDLCIRAVSLPFTETYFAGIFQSPPADVIRRNHAFMSS